MVKKIAVVSLSRGIIGEPFVKHEIDLGIKRIKDYGIELVFMPNALKGLDFIANHPEARASDLIEALKDDSIDMILCAIGGDDTYRLLPCLFDNDELKNALKKKIFLGFSDTTWNHFMFHKLGFDTFYGQSFFSDTCELDKELVPYSKKFFEELIKTGTISEIRPSDTWYEDRNDWSVNAVGTPRVSHKNGGFELLQGPHKFSGKIFGGCIDSIYDMFDNSRYSDTVELTNKYNLFPSLEDWKDKILLIETSEEAPTVEHYKEQLLALKATGMFDVISGIICGKPHDNTRFEEYKKVLVDVIDNKDLPILVNVSVGHCVPRAIVPFGKNAVVDYDNQVIKFN